MRRVCFALGTWQLAVLLACLEQVGGEDLDEHLVLYGGVTPEMRDVMDSLATTRRWTSVTWAEDILRKPPRPGGLDIGAVQVLQARLGLDDADEVWLCKLFDFPEKVAAESLRGATIHLYEDGLHSAISQPTVRGVAPDLPAHLRSTPRRVARVVLWRNDPWFTPGEWAAHRRRVASSWSFTGMIDEHSSGATTTYLEHARLRAVLSQLVASQDVVESSPPSTAVVLGQAFAHFGLMTAEAELEVYRSVCAEVIAAGYAVAYKDHPRLGRGFAAELARRLGRPERFGVLDTPVALPVECWLLAARPAPLVSATSTSLLTAGALGLARPFTFADRLRFPLHRRDHRRMARLVIDRVTPLSELPSSTPSVVGA